MYQDSFNQGLWGTGPTANTDWNAYNAGKCTREWNERIRTESEKSWSSASSSSTAFDWTPSTTAQPAYCGGGGGGGGGGAAMTPGTSWAVIVSLLIGLGCTIISPIMGFNPISAGVTGFIAAIVVILALCLVVVALRLALALVMALVGGTARAIVSLLAPWRWMLALGLAGAAGGFGYAATLNAAALQIQQAAMLGGIAGAAAGFVVGAAVRAAHKPVPGRA